MLASTDAPWGGDTVPVTVSASPSIHARLCGVPWLVAGGPGSVRLVACGVILLLPKFTSSDPRSFINSALSVLVGIMS